MLTAKIISRLLEELEGCWLNHIGLLIGKTYEIKDKWLFSLVFLQFKWMVGSISKRGHVFLL